MSRTKKAETTEAVEATVEAVAEAVAETKTAEVVMEETAAVKKAKLMYVGPTLPGIVIQNRVYAEIPASAAEMIAKDAELRNLFIPVASYPKANKMLREKTGYIYKAYTKAKKLKK